MSISISFFIKIKPLIFFFICKKFFYCIKSAHIHMSFDIYIEKNQRRQILIINCFTPFVLCLLYIFIFFNFDFILWWCRCYISMLCMQCCDDSNTYLHRHRLWFILSFTKLFGIQSLTKHTNRKLTYKIKKHENISY